MTRDADRHDITVASGHLTATISPLGAELIRLADRDGRDLQWNGDPSVWSGRAPILFPIVGALNHGEYRYDGAAYAMPRHGFARHSRFDVVAPRADAATFRLSPNDETRAIYPFEFRLDVTFTLTGATLDVAAEIANHGDVPLPASFGFHPGFRWPLPFGHSRAEHRLRFDRPEPAPIRRIDSDGLLTPDAHPTPVDGDTLLLRDELFDDDAMIFDQLAGRRVTYGAPTGPQLQIDFAGFRELGVWTRPGAGFVCIEPWHGFADPAGFDGDIGDKPGSFLVAPGDTRRLAMQVTLLGG